MFEDIDPDKIEDPDVRQGVRALLNLTESYLEQITTIQEGMAIAAYQAQEEFPALQLLVCDGAQDRLSG